MKYSLQHLTKINQSIRLLQNNIFSVNDTASYFAYFSLGIGLLPYYSIAQENLIVDNVFSNVTDYTDSGYTITAVSEMNDFANGTIIQLIAEQTDDVSKNNENEILFAIEPIPEVLSHQENKLIEEEEEENESEYLFNFYNEFDLSLLINSNSLSNFFSEISAVVIADELSVDLFDLLDQFSLRLLSNYSLSGIDRITLNELVLSANNDSSSSTTQIVNTESLNFSIYRYANDGSSIVTIDDTQSIGNASDYSITQITNQAGDIDNTVFTIDSNTGELTVVDSSRFANNAYYTISINYRDTQGMLQSDDLTVSLYQGFSLSGFSVANSLTEENGFLVSNFTQSSDEANISLIANSIGDINQDMISDIAFTISTDDDISGILGQNNISSQGNISERTILINGFGDSFPASSLTSVGDVNGDTINDFLVGVASGTSDIDAGRAYLIFGQAGVDNSGFGNTTTVGEIDLTPSSLDSSTGIVIDGVESLSRFGSSAVGLGDISGDGIDDFAIVAESLADGGGRPGGVYVVLGNAGLTQIDLNNITGEASFLIAGQEEISTDVGRNIIGMDINNDDINDIIISNSGINGSIDEGRIHIIYGKDTASEGDFSSNSNITLDQLSNTDGFTIADLPLNSDNSDVLSISSAGDMNSDEIEDFMFSTVTGNAVYVIYGKDDPNKDIFNASFNLSALDSEDRFKITGLNTDILFGISIDSVGDINDDGFDDIAIMSLTDSRNAGAGQIYVIYGSQEAMPSEFNVSQINGNNGVIFTVDSFDLLGDSNLAVETSESFDIFDFSVVGIDDFNNDSISDVLISIGGTDFNSSTDTRDYATVDYDELYVLYGGSDYFTPFNESLQAYITIDNETVTESDSIILTVHLNDLNTTSSPITFDIFTELFDTAVANVDYDSSQLGSSAITIAPGASSGQVTVNIVDDGILEANELITFRLENPNTTAVQLIQDEVTVTIIDEVTDYAPVSLSEITTGDGTLGSVIYGSTTGLLLGAGALGLSGDLNGDGRDDLVFRTVFASDDFVVFGRDANTAMLDLSDIANGSSNQGITTINEVFNQISIIGDIDGDGLDDLALGVDSPNTSGNLFYIIYGSTSYDTSLIDIATLTAPIGFSVASTGVGISVESISEAGDITGDGIADFVLGITDSNAVSPSTEAYVLFGENNLNAIDLQALNGTNGLELVTNDSEDFTGLSVTTVNINGDNFSDFIITAPGSNQENNGKVGKIYVIYGKNSFSSDVDANGRLVIEDYLDSQGANSTGNNGFIINGANVADQFGYYVSNAGDFNGDTIDDLLVVAPDADPNGVIDGGVAYIIYGDNTNQFDPEFNLAPTGNALSSLDGTNGFAIHGIELFADLQNISSAGDLNRDGLDDIIIANSNSSASAEGAGQIYVLYGTAQNIASGEFSLSSIDGVNGVIFNGIDERDFAGDKIAGGGDFNGDGFADIAIAADEGDGINNNTEDTGEIYIIYGGSEYFVDQNLLFNASLQVSNGGETSDNSNPITFSVNLDRTNDTGETITFDLSAVRGDALVGQDYDASNLGNAVLSILPGQNSSNTIDLAVLDDVLPEGSEDLVLEISNSSNPLVRFTEKQVTVSIDDSEAITGDASDNTLVGTSNADYIDGQAGNDQLTGDLGDDVFAFADNSGFDIITDFTDGQDQLDFSNHSLVNDIVDLTITDNAGDTVVTINATSETITLESVDFNNITTDDITF